MKSKLGFFTVFFIVGAMLCFACKGKKATLFSDLPSSQTGIKFINQVQDSDSGNILDYLYFYNGGGTAIGDFNNDGLADIYFVSNQQGNALYLNKGGLQFEDITQKAGVAGQGNWKTGVTLVDINNDGLLDIYVSEVGNFRFFRGKNELFINNGDLTFSEKAADYGLDVIGFNTQAVFFDCDHDGDLDVFVVNHSVHSNEVFQDSSVRSSNNDRSGDKLFRNDQLNGTTKFVDITKQSGIYSSAVGYGLNVSAADLNNDGWEDLYVTNDFHENDYYYLNNKNGTFHEINATAFSHESRFSMGSDIADVNNDGCLDIITLDMLAPDEKTLKSSAGDDPFDIYALKYKIGYHYQYSRNCLQLNNGNGLRFSEIGLYAGIAATDWSWSPLLADFNNDGIKDVFISTGIPRRPNDLDFLKYNSSAYSNNRQHPGDLTIINRMPSGKVSNKIFQGTDSLQFIDQTSVWGFDRPTFSTGAAYADLDNDGDLDIVCNNINDEASVYGNNTVEQRNNYSLEIQLIGNKPNTLGIGTKIKMWNHDQVQYSYLTGTHGFESGSLQYIHFGTGKDTVVEKVEVSWPNGQQQILEHVSTRQLLRLSSSNAVSPFNDTAQHNNPSLFTHISTLVNLPFVHHENECNDFAFQPFIPHMISTQGPKTAVADINGDGRDDFFIGGARGQASALFIQTSTGKFISTSQPLFAADAPSETVNATFFDADGDKDLDLYVVRGGNETGIGAMAEQDRLYLNDGKGNFSTSTGLPSLPGNKSVVVAADIDHDGDEDLFVGGRVVAGSYGIIPPSYLLLNQGKGKFIVGADAKAPGLQHVGMVTDAVWQDFNQDGWADLAIVGEWMPVTIFFNKKGILEKDNAVSEIKNSAGLWTTVKVADINGDGLKDLLVGNWGLNSKLKAALAQPLRMYFFDYDGNGTNEQIMAYAHEGEYYTFLGKEELEKNIPLLKKKFLKYSDFAGQAVTDIFGDTLSNAKLFRVDQLTSAVFLNSKQGFLSSKALPFPAQWSPVFGMVVEDFNHDGKLDCMTAGNFYGVLPYEGRYDAMRPAVYWGKGDGTFGVSVTKDTCLNIEGEVRDIKKIKRANGQSCLILTRNNDKPVFLSY